MHKDLKPGMVVLKGRDRLSYASSHGYYCLRVHRSENGARFNLEDRHILDKLGIEYNGDRAYYMWHHELTEKECDALEIDPVVHRILNRGTSNEESMYLLSTDNPF